jgi:hypothetical protein
MKNIEHFERATILKKFENISGDRRVSFSIYIILVFLIFIRRPDAILNAQPWAEDGKIFLQQALTDPYGSILTPYAGYLHIVPRLVTLAAVQFGLPNAPLIMNLVALLISAYCISYLFDTDFRFLIRNDLLRLFTAILIACMPIPQVWMNITNIQWFLLIYTMLWTTNLMFNSNVGDKKIGPGIIFQAVFLGVSFLSSPLSFMLIPGIVLGFMLRIKEKKAITGQLVLYMLSVASLAIHLIFCVTHPDTSRGPGVPVSNVAHYLSGEVFSWFSFIGTTDFLTGIGYPLLYAVSLIIAIVLIYVAIQRADYFISGWLWAIIVMNVLILFLLRQDYLSNFSTNTVFRGAIGGRFLLLPVTMLLLMIMRYIDQARGGLERMKGIWYYVPYLLLLIFLINVVFHFEQQPFVDLHYREYAALYDPLGNATCDVPLNPSGWAMKIPCDIANTGPSS